jgi:hypothetical protein
MGLVSTKRPRLRERPTQPVRQQSGWVGRCGARGRFVDIACLALRRQLAIHRLASRLGLPQGPDGPLAGRRPGPDNPGVGSVEIVEYDPSWPGAFRDLADGLRMLPPP